MKQLLLLAFITLITLIYEGCCLNRHTNDYYFTEEDKKWIVVNPRSEYVFIDSLNLTDTFKLTGAGQGLDNPGNTEEHACVYDRNEQYLFGLQSKDFGHDLSFHMSRGVSSLGLEFWLDACSNFSTSTRQAVVENIGQMQVSDTTFSEVYQIPALICERDTATAIQTAYFVKGVGFVKYITKDGRSCELIR
jgi:hypothetical protein